MAISMARLRWALVMGTALLVLTIAGFLAYARYRTHRFLAGLPGRLGVDIRRETDGYTISKSVGPNTTMTLHASKAVEHNDGKLTLHDVSMVLYGRKQDRQDRISGAEFEYDQQTGVVRAAGEVHIDLQAPAHGQAGMPLTDAGHAEPGIVHVTTSGLVFLQRLGVAATDQEIEFRLGAMTGRARGAEYNSDTGVVILQSDVEAHGEEHGAPVTLRAAHAELDRPNLVATATDARYTSLTQTARGDRAVVHLRPDSTPDRLDAEGNVQLANAAGGSLTAPHAEVLLDEAGRARSAHLSGGVSYAEAANLREARSQAGDARIAFDAQGKAQTVSLTGKAHVEERVRSSPTTPWSGRDALAERMDFAFDGGVLRAVDAREAARVTLRDAAGTSELSGDTVQGHFTGADKSVRLNDLHADGHTRLHRLLADGAEQTSAGDTLDGRMGPGTAGKGDAVQAIDRATQTGHVVLTSTAASSPGAKTSPTTSRATAEQAVFEGATGHVTLSGGAEVVDETGRVAANHIVLDRTTGDATAEGTVKATYLQPSAADQAGAPHAAEPVHVIADRAVLRHDAQTALFYGVSRPARLWQGGSQVEAPVLQLERAARRLLANGGPLATGAPVHAVLAGATTDRAKPPSVVQVVSRTMIYRDDTRQVTFAGEVRVEDASGIARAAEAVAFLKPSGAATAGVSLGGGLERIVAKGNVEIEQPGRHASGEQLVYTAGDGLFVLTGTPALRPRLMDETQGTVTGQSLSFHADDRSVIVLGSPGERVRTVTKVKEH